MLGLQDLEVRIAKFFNIGGQPVHFTGFGADTSTAPRDRIAVLAPNSGLAIGGS